MQQIVLFVALIGSIGAADVAEDCTAMKREERCAAIFIDKESCHNTTLRPFLMNCLVTCDSCEAFSCDNPEPETKLNCTALSDQCDSNTWRDIMKSRCPATCGLCDLKNGLLCNDKDATGVCSALSKFCNSVDYYNKMTVLCASTCNRCPNNGSSTVSPGCMDTAVDCAINQHRCNNPGYAALMSRICTKTCKKCNDGCFDKYNMCPQWARNGFCTSKGYDETKKRDCAHSCNLCHSPL